MNSSKTASTLFTLAVHDTGQANQLALRFASAALHAGHRINQVFFYHDAVHTANALQTPNPEDLVIDQDWAAIAATGGFSLCVCVAAAQRRGLTEHIGDCLNQGFELVGLGVYVAGIVDADRLVTFSN